MDEMRLRLVLCETGQGTTCVRLEGTLEPAPSARGVQRFFALLALWTGQPTCVALCVEPTRVAWCEAWLDALADVDPGHLELHFAPPPGAWKAAP